MQSYTALTNLSMQSLVMCNVFTDVGGIKYDDCPPVRKIIRSLKLVDYLPLQVGNPWYTYYIIYLNSRPTIKWLQEEEILEYRQNISIKLQWYHKTTNVVKSLLVKLIFTDRSKAVLLWILFCKLCFVFVMLSCLFIAALWSPVGKGVTSLLCYMICFLVFCHFPMWCPG